MRKLFLLVSIIVLSVNIFAGDVSNFVNLGFSPDGRYFLFGEHGVESSRAITYGNMWLVNVAGNSFVKGGVFSGSYETVVEPGESSLGALLKLINSGSSKIKQYKIDFLDQGRPIYVRFNDDENLDTLNFKDFPTGRKYSLELEKKVFGSGTGVSSSFKIDLQVTESNGKVRFYTVGNPSYSRKGVSDYKIVRVLINEAGDSLVIVLSKSVNIHGEVGERFMVETVSLK